MSSKTEAILKLFEKHRIVFWYNDGGESDILNDYDLPGVEKIVVDNNEFTIKHRILLQEPTTRFLLYFPVAKPKNEENWLLDLLLANKEFKADESFLVLIELGLSESFYPTIQEHYQFFKNRDREKSLKERLQSFNGTVTKDLIERTMIAVVCKEYDASTEALLFKLLELQSRNQVDAWDNIVKFKLDYYWWQRIMEVYGYTAPNPSLYDFILELFKQSHTGHSSLSAEKSQEALLMLRRWKDKTTCKKTFEYYSAKASEDLGYASEKPATIDPWRTKDDFRFVEEWIINFLAQGLSNQTIQPDTVQNWIEARKTSYWYSYYQSLYAALGHAGELRRIIQNATWKFDSAEALLSYYTQIGYKGDYHYRKFIYEFEYGNRIAGLDTLAKSVESYYINKFQVPLNDAWMAFVDDGQFFKQEKIPKQRDFFRNVVKPYYDKETAVFVIISDALRYESGEDLCSRLLQTDKCEAKIEPMVATLPSYSKAGMASLLPHKELLFDIESNVILADNQNVDSTAARNTLLATALNGKACAVTFEEFRQKTTEFGRDWVKPYKVVYVYHNTIDKAGDDIVSECKVFEATEQAFKDIQDILKTIYNMNRNNVIITADHGYLYQHSNLHESDFVDTNLPEGVIRKNRRFVLGEALPECNGMHRFSIGELGFVGKGDCLIPKGNLRLRQQGSGSRYVHGGASLQELVIPVIRFNRKREKTVEQVEIAVLGVKPKITTNLVPVNFYQQAPVGDAVLPRTIIAGVYSEDGKLLSDKFTYTFEFKSNEASNREKKHTFHLSGEISRYNGQNIILRLEEPVQNTNTQKIYVESRHQIFITFTNDFD